jgi:hypothetical protein
VTGSRNISDDSYNLGSSQKLPLNGTGTTPHASVSPASLSFSTQVAGTTSKRANHHGAQQRNRTAEVSNVTATGPFSQSNNCSAPLAPAASCAIQVSFAPILVGAASGSITITDNAGTQTVALSGTGSAPVTFSPTSLSFGNLVVQTSATSTITLTNRLNTALTVSNVAVSGTSGPFAVTSNTCASVAAGASCTVSVTFSPTTVGSATGTLTFTDSAVTSPQTVSLSGTGIGPVTLSVTSLSFSTTVAGNTSAAKTVTLTNNQSSALSITSIKTNPPFAVASNTCGTSVPTGKNCTVGVTFSPTAVGSVTGTLTFTDSAVTGPQTVSLSGTGSAPVTFSSTSINFGTVKVGSKSSAKTVTLTNHLSSALTIASVSASTGFAVASNTCGASIGAGASCTVGVTFSPTATGSVTGALTFTDSAVTSQQVVARSGTGQ